MKNLYIKLYFINFLLNIILNFIVGSLNNINEIILFNLITIFLIEFFFSKRESIGLNLTIGSIAMISTILATLVVSSVLSMIILGVFKDDGKVFLKKINIYPPDTSLVDYVLGNKPKNTNVSKNDIYSKYLDKKLFKELGDISTIEVKNLKFNEDIVLPVMMYANTISALTACDIIVKVYDEYKNEKLENLSNFNTNKDKKIEECKLVKEIYEKYKYMYELTVKNKKIPNFYYLPITTNDSEKKVEFLGMFPTMKECQYYSDIFKNKDIYLIGNCKNYKR